ncbi:MAG: NAD(P)H-binding protein [Spirochaetaceae bacterium]|nr:NAD(P)H-binding protein [Myxococcales bacterium]MCB9722660.1 NAD(P)H-binding protein [Spirochaetaceae bacterium]
MEDRRIRRIAIAGATGFVGSSLATRLARQDVVYALGRRATAESPEAELDDTPRVVPRRCDLFSVGETARALEGAEVAVYLVHSMSPNARLTQGRFEDLDLLLADNFARAAARAGVRRIVYLGGLLPRDPDHGLSAHLASRLEVEKALGAHGLPVTAVRAGLVVGAEGSSLNLLVRLVERLPVMICPAWTASPTQPIALSDVVEILARCCLDEETTGRVCEVGGPDVMSYREMMQTTARVLGRRRPMLPVPFVTPALSELWVSLVTGTSRSLVRPLIESLRHPMVVEDGWLQQRMGRPGRPFAEALEESLRRSRIWKRPIARSVQRVSLPPGRDVAWLAEDYPRWLEGAAPTLLRVEREGDRLEMTLRPLRRALLVLERRRDADGRQVFRVTGGLLARRDARGEPRLEFRVTPDGRHALIALQDFEPRLPWWLYAVTQAPLHRAVMAAYRLSLQARSRAARTPVEAVAGRPTRPSDPSGIETGRRSDPA